jgi:cyclopropane fatty-acyl-phospholipid synthase-like methyltransferase
VKPADDPHRDYHKLVERGYDAIAPAFNAARSREDTRALTPLLERLPERARLLDLGCGAGVPITRALAERFHVTGVDVSAEQLALARTQVPGATFMRADMAHIAFDDASFDAVVSFYAIFHLPREEHPPLLERIFAWLKPGGFFMATLAHYDEAPYTEQDFFGVEMYWSNFSLATYRQMLERCGFELLAAATISHGYGPGDEHRPEAHPLVFARRPA